MLNKGRIVAIDFGLARIGVAISDENQIIATPLFTLAAKKKQFENAKLLIERLAEYTIECIVVGFPLHLSGKVGFMADEVKHFVAELEKLAPCPISLLDERLTTLQAERALKEGNFSRKKRKRVIDTVAAVILLQNYLATKTPPY